MSHSESLDGVVLDDEGNLYGAYSNHGGGGLRLRSYDRAGPRWTTVTHALRLLWHGDRLLLVDGGDTRDAYDTQNRRLGIRAVTAGGENLWVKTAHELLPEVPASEQLRLGGSDWRLDALGRPVIELQAVTACETWILTIDPTEGAPVERKREPGCEEGRVFAVDEVRVTYTPLQHNESRFEAHSGGTLLWSMSAPRIPAFDVSSSGVLIEHPHRCAGSSSLRLLDLRTGALVREMGWDTASVITGSGTGWASGRPSQATPEDGCTGSPTPRVDLLVFDPDTGAETARISGAGGRPMAVTDRGTVLIVNEGDGEGDRPSRLVEVDANGDAAVCEARLSDTLGLSVFQNHLVAHRVSNVGTRFLAIYSVPGLRPLSE